MVARPGLRLTSRVLLIDEVGSVLLFLTKAPDSSCYARWITPGGGVDPGEDHREAAIRELREETGLEIDDPGEPVWAWDFDVTWDEADHDRGHSEFYVVRTPRFEPSSEGWTEDEHVDMLDSRWWSIAELLATTEPYEPPQLIDLLRRELPSC